MATILCVDADPAVGADLERALHELGHRTVLTARVDAALRAVSDQAFDLVLADTKLPDASGLDLLRTLAEQGRDLPVVMLTRYSSVEDAVLSLRAGAIDYLTKPVRLEALRLAVNSAIEAVRLRRENDLFPSHASEAAPAPFAQLRLARPGRPPRIVVPAVPLAAANERAAGATATAIEESFDLTLLEKRAIRRALTATAGNRTRAARLLGISERTLRKKLNTGFLDR